MNSLVRMIGAGLPDRQARIAAWTCGSSGATSSQAGGDGWDWVLSGAGVAGTRSSSGGAVNAGWEAQPASRARLATKAARAAALRAVDLRAALSIESPSRTARMGWPGWRRPWQAAL